MKECIECGFGSYLIENFSKAYPSRCKPCANDYYYGRFPKAYCVYFVKLTDGIRIGSTGNLRTRMIVYRSSNLYVEVLKVFTVSDNSKATARNLEKKVFSDLDAYRLRAEFKGKQKKTSFVLDCPPVINYIGAFNGG